MRAALTQPTSAVLTGAWASARVGSALYAAAFAVWMLYALAMAPKVSGSLLTDIAGIALASAFWFVVLCVVCFVISIPLVALIGGTAHLLTGSSQLNAPLTFAIGGFAVGSSLWLALLLHPSAGVIFRDWWSAFAIAGPAGAAGGHEFSRRMQNLG